MTRRAQIGMAMFLISETVFFSLLIGAFKYFQAAPIRPSRSGVLTILLLAATSCAGLRWRWATVALGAAFLIGLLAASFSPLTAIHGLHIAAGIIGSVVVPASALPVMAFYWLFFTVVWIAMLAL
jgi:heme/copper-type cytochrome/quinol oxidase subunit 3